MGCFVSLICFLHIEKLLGDDFTICSTAHLSINGLEPSRIVINHSSSLYLNDICGLFGAVRLSCRCDITYRSSDRMDDSTWVWNIIIRTISFLSDGRAWHVIWSEYRVDNSDTTLVIYSCINHLRRHSWWILFLFLTIILCFSFCCCQTDVILWRLYGIDRILRNEPNRRAIACSHDLLFFCRIGSSDAVRILARSAFTASTHVFALSGSLNIEIWHSRSGCSNDIFIELILVFR